MKTKSFSFLIFLSALSSTGSIYGGAQEDSQELLRRWPWQKGAFYQNPYENNKAITQKEAVELGSEFVLNNVSKNPEILNNILQFISNHNDFMNNGTYSSVQEAIRKVSVDALGLNDHGKRVWDLLNYGNKNILSHPFAKVFAHHGSSVIWQNEAFLKDLLEIVVPKFFPNIEGQGQQCLDWSDALNNIKVENIPQDVNYWKVQGLAEIGSKLMNYNSKYHFIPYNSGPDPFETYCDVANHIRSIVDQIRNGGYVKGRRAILPSHNKEIPSNLQIQETEEIKKEGKFRENKEQLDLESSEKKGDIIKERARKTALEGLSEEAQNQYLRLKDLFLGQNIGLSKEGRISEIMAKALKNLGIDEVCSTTEELAKILQQYDEATVKKIATALREIQEKISSVDPSLNGVAYVTLASLLEEALNIQDALNKSTKIIDVKPLVKKSLVKRVEPQEIDHEDLESTQEVSEEKDGEDNDEDDSTPITEENLKSLRRDYLSHWQYFAKQTKNFWSNLLKKEAGKKELTKKETDQIIRWNTVLMNKKTSKESLSEIAEQITPEQMECIAMTHLLFIAQKKDMPAFKKMDTLQTLMASVSKITPKMEKIVTDMAINALELKKVLAAVSKVHRSTSIKEKIFKVVQEKIIHDPNKINTKTDFDKKSKEIISLIDEAIKKSDIPNAEKNTINRLIRDIRTTSRIKTPIQTKKTGKGIQKAPSKKTSKTIESKNPKGVKLQNKSPSVQKILKQNSSSLKSAVAGG